MLPDAQQLLSDPTFRNLVADELEASARREQVSTNPEAIIAEGQLRIQNKRAELVPLHLNTCQRKVWDTLRTLQTAGKPLRVLILKFRQGGISTLIEALLYCRNAFQANRNALILADDEKKSTHLYDILKRYHEHLEQDKPNVVPALKRSNARELVFAEKDSRVVVGSAENPDISRAFTWQDAHLSEVASYPQARAQQLFTGFWPSVAKVPSSMVVLETTARGHDAVFYPLWKAAIAGENDFTPIFLAWFEMDEYTYPSEYPVTAIHFDTDGGLADYLEEERALQAEHQLTDQQLWWRRWAIVNECQGEVSQFRQEYPATWQEAFQTTGRGVFRAATLKREADLAEHHPPRVGRLVTMAGRVEFREDPTGWCKVYVPPQGQEARIGGDTCEGLAWGEQAALVAVEARSRDCLATVSGTIPPDQLGAYAALLGHYYHHAAGEPPIAIESNGYGHSANLVLRQQYGNVYSTTAYDAATQMEQRKDGFLTTASSRSMLIDLAKMHVREGACKLRDLKLIDQLQTFVQHPNGKIDHEDGSFSDLVFAWMIALWLCEQRPPLTFRQLSETMTGGGSYETAKEEIPVNGGVVFA